MGYGILGFGLLTNSFNADTVFADNDWRKWKGGDCFWLPLFKKEYLERELKVGERLNVLAREFNKTLPQHAIAWVLRKFNSLSILFGTYLIWPPLCGITTDTKENGRYAD